MYDYSKLIESVMDGDNVKSVELTRNALEEGASPQEVARLGLQTPMRVVGDKFSAGDIFIPDMLLATRALTSAMEVLRSSLSASGIATVGRVVIGTVYGDIHQAS